MDITQVNNEKVRLRDIFSSLKDIFGTSKSEKEEDFIDKRVKDIYAVQTELGATKNIEALEKEIQKHGDVKTKKSSKILASKKEVSDVAKIRLDEKDLDDEKEIDR